MICDTDKVVWFGGGVVSSICSGRRMVPPT